MDFKRLSLLLLLPVISLVGCSSTSTVPQDPPQSTARNFKDSEDLIPIVAALHDQMHSWHGTPYEWGGTDKKGVDCSGFVWRTLKDRFNLPMDRVTTRELVHMGTKVQPQQLLPGDLVFFRIKGDMHVGFYDTARTFLHASVSHGVIRSSLDNPYWKSAFYQARRLPKEYGSQITLNTEKNI